LQQHSLYDIAIIGGGINGTGIACDAAGRGLSVLLCEQHDLASATSSASSKLIHGGLRYLEQYEFRLVKEALAEREILLRKASHLIKPLQFIMPHNRAMRSEWLIRIGLFLYDQLATNVTLEKSQCIHMANHPAGLALHKQFSKGFIYSDCLVDDSRLVILNALCAKEHGAIILTRTACISAHRRNDCWELILQHKTGQKVLKHAKVLVNATGSWVEDFLYHNVETPPGQKIRLSLRLIKGSHIVVPKLYEGNFAYLLQNDDKRVVFVIPYYDHFNLIGTTEVPFVNNPSTVKITADEISYLCTAVSKYFAVKISAEDILHSYSGVRPLINDNKTNPTNITRDYAFEIQDKEGTLPILSIFGGKLTTYRKLAENALAKLQGYLPMQLPWTANVPLPGGDFNKLSPQEYSRQLSKDYPWLPNELVHRYSNLYGTLSTKILKDVHALSDLGKYYGASLYQREVEYLIDDEWANSLEDILWRRTKLGYFFPKESQQQLATDIAAYLRMKIKTMA
jgi:glycerol-3-phosphate dehydrogenase